MLLKKGFRETVSTSIRTALRWCHTQWMPNRFYLRIKREALKQLISYTSKSRISLPSFLSLPSSFSSSPFLVNLNYKRGRLRILHTYSSVISSKGLGQSKFISSLKKNGFTHFQLQIKLCHCTFYQFIKAKLTSAYLNSASLSVKPASPQTSSRLGER